MENYISEQLAHAYKQIGNVNFETSNGVYNSFDDFRLILPIANVSDKIPEQKRTSIEIPYQDGKIDTTYALRDDPIFENRPVEYKFLMYPFLVQNREEMIDRIINVLHGKELKIYYSKKPGYYLKGNVSVDASDTDPGVQTVTVTVDADPYYNAITETSTTFKVANGSSIGYSLINSRKWVVPKITCQGTVSLSNNGIESTFTNAKDEVNSNFILRDGINTITVTGKTADVSTVTITYREGIL